MSHRYLSVRIAVVVGLIALLGAVLISLLFYWRVHGLEVATARRTTSQLAQTVQQTASIAAYLDDAEVAQEVLRGLGSNEIVAGGSLTSVTGLSVDFGSVPMPEEAAEAVRLTLESPFTPGKRVGELILYPRQSFIESSARAVALENAELVGGYTLLIALLVMAVIQWQFVPLLRRLAAQLHRIEPGGTERLSLPARHRGDELGRLVDDINGLLDLVRDKLEGERTLRGAIQELERRFRLIFERAGVGIFLLDETGQVVMSNPAFREIVGDGGGGVGETGGMALTSLFAEADMVGVMAEETAAQGKVTSADLRLARGLSRSPRWVHCLLTPIGDDAREPAGGRLRVQGILTDVTELRQAREQAEARAHAQAHFLAHMSHEIRTPMNGIIGLAELALHRPLDATARDYLEKLHQSGVNLLAILNDILDQSKIEAGHLELEQAVFDQESLLEEQRSLFAHVAHARGLGFAVEAGPGVPRWLVGDALRLGQVLANLLSNAIKFTEQGRVDLRVDCLERTAERARLRWTVTDTGIGMDSATRGRLFQPFTQGDESTARRFGGTGLGLSISRHLVGLMGGRLELETAPGRGSRFWLELSLATAAQAPSTASSSALPLAAGLPAARVLVAEDQPINQQVIGDMLRLLGIEHDLACNGREALARLADTHYDAVLMDIQMPEMDGLTATRHLRDDPARAGLPVIALTAGVTPAERERMSAAGMSDLLSKPVTLDALRATLVRWLGAAVGLGGEGADATHPDAGAESVLELPGFDLRPLQQVSGAHQVAERLSQFAATVRDDVVTIAAALAADRRQEAASRLHRLKGLAGTIGALDLQAASRALEEALERGVDPAVPLTALHRAHAQALARIDGLPPPEAPPATVAEASPEAARVLAQEIHARLGEGLYVPTHLLTDLEAALPGEERALLLTVKRHLQQFDYLAADRLLEPLWSADGTDIPGSRDS